MDSNRLNISKIETFFDSLLRGTVTDNLFFSELPSAIDEKWTEMIVVDCNAMADWDAYGRGTVLLMVYVPPMSSGRKNVTVFSNVEKKLNDVIASSTDDVYRIQRRETYTDYDTERNLFVNIIEINLIVLT